MPKIIGTSLFLFFLQTLLSAEIYIASANPVAWQVPFGFFQTIDSPNIPTNLRAIPSTDTIISLYWTDNASNETGFEIERSPDGSTGWSLINTTAANAITYADTGLIAGATWFYRIRAINATAESGYTAVVSTTARNIQRIFATSTTYNGSMGGQSGADAYCSTRAVAGGFPANGWRAILSAPEMFAKDYIWIKTNQHVYNLRPASALGPQLIATSSTDMWDGTIGAAVGYNELGGTIGSNIYTGTLSDGSVHATWSCDGFTTTSGTGKTGISNQSNSSWINTSQSSCGTTRSIYCIDGQDGPKNLNVYPVSQTQLDLNFTDTSSDEIEFLVERSATGVGGWSQIGTVPGSGASVQTYSDTGLTPGVVWFYRVRASFASGNSNYTNIMSGAGKLVHRMFVTSTTSSGNQGGLSGADGRCATRAATQSLGGTWKALVSSATIPVSARIAVLPDRDIRNLRPISLGGPELIAMDAVDLWDNTLNAPVRYSEDGVAVSTGSVWTGSNSDGSLHVDTCSSWSTTATNGNLGNALLNSNAWITNSSGSCLTSFKLYCIDGQEYPAMRLEVTATPFSSSQIDIGWTDSESETSYEIERSPDGSTGWVQIATPTADSTSYSNTGLSSGATWYYRIRAVNAAGNSNWSFTVFATTP